MPDDVPRITDCGMTGNIVSGVSGATRPRSLGKRFPANVSVVKKKIKRRLRTRSVDQSQKYSDFCSIEQLKPFCEVRNMR